MSDTTHCRRHGPPGLGFARPPDGRGRDAPDRRRGRAGDRPGRRLDRGARGDRAARRRRGGSAAATCGAPSRRSAVRSPARCVGHDAADQAAIDRVLVALDRHARRRARLGGNALVAVSMAALHAAAAAHGKPLYAHLLGAGADAVLPLPEIQIFGGGAHAGRRVDVQDFMIVAPARTFLRRGARMDRRGLSRGRRVDGRAGGCCRASPTRAASGRPSSRTRRRSTR